MSLKKTRGRTGKTVGLVKYIYHKKDKGAQERSNICFSTEVSTLTAWSNFALIFALMRLQYDLAAVRIAILSVEPLTVGLLVTAWRISLNFYPVCGNNMNQSGFKTCHDGCRPAPSGVC